ncbi:MAG: hypothetical protein MI785_28145 [Kiloniellales bacterium]|nr:hypothetical protein [Kiloniellales bacterium]
MFLWRSLPPSAVAAALTWLMTIRERRKAPSGPASAPERAEEKVRQERLDEAVAEIQSRL